MAMLYGSVNQAGFKAPDSTPPGDDLTDKEALLTMKFGNLHEYIPQQLNKRGVTQTQLAATMSVSAAWLSYWLKRNGYTRISRWERK